MSYKLYDLSQPVYNGAVMWPRLADNVIFGGAGPFQGESRANRPWWPLRWRSGQPGFSGHLHGGTHVDAPIYCIDGGISLEKIPLENLYGTGVVVDFRYMKKWDKITAEDFDNAKPAIREGDFVVVNTGWHRFYGGQNYVYFHHYPGLVPSAAEWLIKKKVKAIAGTWATSDHSLAFAPLQTHIPWLYEEYKNETGKDPGEEFPNFEPCLTMLLENGISCIQNAGEDIDQVTGKRCTLAAFPFVVEHADAGMARLVAIVED
jgi:kynurenine formamidase